MIKNETTEFCKLIKENNDIKKELKQNFKKYNLNQLNHAEQNKIILDEMKKLSIKYNFKINELKLQEILSSPKNIFTPLEDDDLSLVSGGFSLSKMSLGLLLLTGISLGSNTTLTFASGNNNGIYSSDSKIVRNYDANSNYLYEDLNTFLESIEDIPLDNLEKTCIEYMKSKIGKPNVLSESVFQSRLHNKKLLLRGVEKKEYSDQLKSGEIFLSTSKESINLTGNGIYCTSHEGVAKFFMRNTGTVMRMFLEDTAKSIDEENLNKIIQDMIKTDLSQNEKFLKISENKGLIALLLGYDVIYSYFPNDPDFGESDQYLVVNANVLNICEKDNNI